MKSFWTLLGLLLLGYHVHAQSGEALFAFNAIYDINGIRIDQNDMILVPQKEVKLPEVPGVYYLQVVTEINTSGAMIAIQ